MAEESIEENATIEQLIESGQLKALSIRLEKMAYPEVADLMFQLDKPHRILVYRALPRPRAAEVFAFLEPDAQDELLDALTDTDTRHLLANLSPDDRTAMLEELPATVQRCLMQLLSEEDLEEARQLLGYPEESVGRLMTPDYIRVRAEWTCDQALAHIRKFGRDSEVFNILYVTDGNGLLIDVLHMRRLMLANPSTVIKEILSYKFVSISAYEDREMAVEKIQRYDISALPVVDSDGVIVGIVTVDDIMDVAEEEATEDIQLGAAVAPLESRYSATAPLKLFRKRIIWLLVLIFVNLISAGVISSYEAYLLEFITLALFMPLVIASGGNSGAQSATLMVRAMATGDLGAGDCLRALGKEAFVGLLLGIAMGVIAYGVGAIYGRDGSIALIIGLSMVSIVLVANTFGALLPFALHKVDIDPAVASSPLITSVMDVLGLIIYFSIAVLVLTPAA